VLFKEESYKYRIDPPTDGTPIVPLFILRYSDAYVSKVGATNAVKLTIGNLPPSENRRLSRIMPETFFPPG
jgi:hypothetical protein